MNPRSRRNRRIRQRTAAVNRALSRADPFSGRASQLRIAQRAQQQISGGRFSAQFGANPTTGTSGQRFARVEQQIGFRSRTARANLAAFLSRTAASPAQARSGAS